MTPALLVLWDVDHTLIDSGGVGGEIYAAAFEKISGQALEQMAEMSGRTEPVIFRDTLALHGIDDPGGMFDRFAEEQARGYASRADELRQRGRALPGAANALATLAGLSSKDVIQSVLTGNTRPSAEIKLRTFGLDTWLDLDIGAYGTDDDTRANLVPIARQRATARTGYEFGKETTVLIGDTPADITAARDGSARIIAVATGQHSTADLADADTVLADLTSTPALMAALYPREPSQ